MLFTVLFYLYFIQEIYFKIILNFDYFNFDYFNIFLIILQDCHTLWIPGYIVVSFLILPLTTKFQPKFITIIIHCHITTLPRRETTTFTIKLPTTAFIVVITTFSIFTTAFLIIVTTLRVLMLILS